MRNRYEKKEKQDTNPVYVSLDSHGSEHEEDSLLLDEQWESAESPRTNRKIKTISGINESASKGEHDGSSSYGRKEEARSPISSKKLAQMQQRDAGFAKQPRRSSEQADEELVLHKSGE